MPRANKTHKCQLCLSEIAPGMDYEELIFKPWDHPDSDGFATYRFHCDCFVVANQIFDICTLNYGECSVADISWAWGVLWENIEEDNLTIPLHLALAVQDAKEKTNEIS